MKMKLLLPLFLVIAVNSPLVAKDTPVKVDASEKTANQRHSAMLDEPKSIYIEEAIKLFKTHAPEVDLSEYAFNGVSASYIQDEEEQIVMIEIDFNKKGGRREIQTTTGTRVENDSIEFLFTSLPGHRTASILLSESNKRKEINIPLAKEKENHSKPAAKLNANGSNEKFAMIFDKLKSIYVEQAIKDIKANSPETDLTKYTLSHTRAAYYSKFEQKSIGVTFRKNGSQRKIKTGPKSVKTEFDEISIWYQSDTAQRRSIITILENNKSKKIQIYNDVLESEK